MSHEIAQDLHPSRGFQFQYLRLFPFVPAILMWSAESLVGLGWLMGAVGGSVTPGVGSSRGSIMTLFTIMILIGIGGILVSIWVSTRRHRWIWAGVSFCLAFLFFIGSLGD